MTVSAMPHHLTLAERRALLALVERGQIDHVEMDRAGKRALERAISGLRRKIDPSMRIVTVHGQGYWLERTA